MMDEDVKRKLEAAIAGGANPQEALQRAIAVQSQRTSPQGQNQAQTEKGGGNFIGNIAKAVISPFVGTGRTMLGGFVQAPTIALSQGKMNPRNLPGIGKAFLSDDELKQAGEDPMQFIGDQVKRSLQVASYGVPVGGSTSLFGKTLAPGVFKGGAAAGSMYGLGEGQGKDRTGDEVLSDVATNGFISGTLAKVLPGLFSKLRGGGEAARRSVIKPQVSDSATAFGQKQQIMSGLDDVAKHTGVKFKGSSAAQEQQIDKAYNILFEEIRSKTGKKTFDALEVARRIQEGVNFETKADSQNFNRLVGNKITQVMKDGKISDKDLLLLKFDLGKTASKGTSNKATIAKDMWENLDSFLEENLSGDIKSISKMQSILHRASPGVQQQIEAGVQIPFLGKYESVGRVAQGAADTTGRMLTGVGGTGEKIMSSIGGPEATSNILAKGTGPVLSSQKNQPPQTSTPNASMSPGGNILQNVSGMTPPGTEQMAPQPNQQEILSPEGQWKWDAQANDWVPAQSQPQSIGDLTPDQMAMIMLQLPKDQASRLESAWNIIQKGKELESKTGKGATVKLSEADKKLAQARDIAQEAYTILNENDFETGIPSGIKSKINELTGKQDPVVTDFKSKITMAKSNFRTAMIGAGQTESEAKNLADAMFDLSQPRSVLVARMEAFIQAQNNYMDKYAGNSIEPQYVTSPQQY